MLRHCGFLPVLLLEFVLLQECVLFIECVLLLDRMCSLICMCSLILQVRVLRGVIEDLRHELQQAEEHAAYVDGVSGECVYLHAHKHYICI